MSNFGCVLTSPVSSVQRFTLESIAELTDVKTSDAVAAVTKAVVAALAVE